MTIREMAEATGYVQGTISPCKAWQEAKRIWGQEAESHLLQKYGNRVVDNQDFKGAASVVRRTIRAPDKRRGRTGVKSSIVDETIDG